MRPTTKFISISFSQQLGSAERLLMDLRLWHCRAIIEILAEAGPAGMHVTDLEDCLTGRHGREVKQADISRHLRILRRRQIAIYTKRGKYHWYQLNVDRLEEIASAIHRFTHSSSKPNMHYDKSNSDHTHSS